jgi:hypothetical protein
MFKIKHVLTAIALATLLMGCMTISETDQPDRPWYDTTIYSECIPWPWPVGDLGMVDYYNAHGAAWWDAPWVLTEQILLVPTYITYGLGETFHTDLSGGSTDYSHDTWQWKSVCYTLGPIHAVVSSVNYALIWAVDTVGHDPIAAIWWMQAKDDSSATVEEGTTTD